MKDRLIWIFLLLFSVAFFTVSCSTVPVGKKGAGDEEILKDRTAAYWGYIVKGDLVNSYNLEYPLYRKKVSLTRYIQRKGTPLIRYISFDIKEVQTVSQDAAEVKIGVKVRLKVRGAKPFMHETVLSDRWMKVEGQWYHVPDKNTFTQKEMN